MPQRHRITKKYRSTSHYVLSALVPYTEANLKLAFKPNIFFDDLANLSETAMNKAALKTSYYRLVQKGCIELDTRGQPTLSDKGKQQLSLYEPQKLPGGAGLLLVFDIPENQRAKRDHLRTLLRELKFRMIQQSVWHTAYDSREYLRTELEKYQLTPYVKLYESVQLQF